jgi:hypothetical protein
LPSGDARCSGSPVATTVDADGERREHDHDANRPRQGEQGLLRHALPRRECASGKDASIGPAESEWARTFVADLAPYDAFAYLNFLDRDDQHRKPAAFAPAAYERLLRLQVRYEPDNVLRLKQEPADRA